MYLLYSIASIAAADLVSATTERQRRNTVKTCIDLVLDIDKRPPSAILHVSGLQHPFSGSGTIWADGVRKTEAISAILGGNGDGICETEERLKDIDGT